MKIAVIGSGISGLTAAYILSKKHEVSVYEKRGRLGGHTATIDVMNKGEIFSIDTGFIVYNDCTYPSFIKLLDQLKVKTQKTCMGFSVSCEQSGLEYAGNSLNALFAQRKNIFSLSFLIMLKDILRFNKQSVKDLEAGLISEDMTLVEYLKENNYSDGFCKNYLVPMGAAIWSASLSSMNNFPVVFFIRFFHNHGLLSIFNRPQWHVICGGSKSYIEPLTEPFKDNVFLNSDISGVVRHEKGVRLMHANGETSDYDQVVMACHSDQALEMLGDPSNEEKDILGAIKYQNNDVVLHTDESLLPKTSLTWSSWNYRLTGNENALPVLTYNMNILQSIHCGDTFCVTLNSTESIKVETILGQYEYAHPEFNNATVKAQKRWLEINGVNNTWFCGAYWGSGFHEDGVVSALRIAEKFGLTL